MSNQFKIVRASTKSLSSTLSINDTQVTDLTDWACFIQFRSKNTKVIAGNVDREITTKNQAQDAFVITLTNTETNIPEGFYILGVEYRNSTTGQVLEDPNNIIEIEIVEGWVYT